MDEEFSNEEIKELVELALSPESNQFFPKSGLSVGFGESQAFQVLADSLQPKFAYSELSSAFQDAREALVNSKINTTLKDLHTITMNCNKCKNFKPSPNLPMWNVVNPDVLFILDYPIYDKTVAEYFLSVLKDSGFSSSTVCLTYVNRCNYPKRKFEPEEIFNCSPYLHTEIQLINPKLIVCMGSLPSAALFGTDMTIKDCRSQILWLGSWPVTITYTPIHAIKSGKSLQDHFSSDISYAYSYITRKEN
jgi:uracil-DNA glycosylase family 4